MLEKTFDLIEYQQLVRETNSQRDLYLILDLVSTLREKLKITSNEYDEIIDHIKNRQDQLNGK